MINYFEVSTHHVQLILERFPEAYQEKLRTYTGQELFYAYKLATYKPRNPKALTSKDVFMLSLKMKMFRWLKGEEKYGIHPAAWDKLGKGWRYESEEFFEVVESEAA